MYFVKRCNQFTSMKLFLFNQNQSSWYIALQLLVKAKRRIFIQRSLMNIIVTLPYIISLDPIKKNVVQFYESNQPE